MAYIENWGVEEEDAEKGVQLLKTAADNGEANAQITLAGMYRKGEHVEKNVAEAIHWYRMAALQGHEHAQLALGTIFMEGTRKNPLEAKKWLKQAAGQGNSRARALLSQLN